MARSRVELFEAIRRDARREELSIRALADRHGVHRRTVRQALASAVPPARKTPARAAPKLERAKPHIEAMLRSDLDAPRKQRHTARRVWARLVEEHAMSELSYSAVRDYVARRRREILLEAGRAPETACVPQTHEPGAEAEVDFADLWIDLAGERTKVFLFTLRLSYSGKAVHQVFASQGQEAFLEGHLHAFEVIGGVPADRIRYDNLRCAVSRVLFGRNRLESERWIAFRSHYGFDAFYCQPGPEGAHEKGGVEGEVGFRRTHLVPVPAVADLAELNARIEAADARDDARRIEHRTMSVGHDFDLERRALRPLPVEGVAPGLVLTPRVDRYARISVRQCRYSVPARLIGARVRVSLRASELVVFDGAREVGPPPARGGPRLADPGARPLPGGAGPQARGAAGGHRAGPGPRGRAVHPGARGVLGRRPGRPRRPGRHPGADRGVAAAPAPGPPRRGGRAVRRPRGGLRQSGPGRRGGPQGRPTQRATGGAGRRVGPRRSAGAGRR